MRLTRPALALCIALLLAASAPAGAKEKVGGFAVPASGVIGVDESQLQPSFWIARLERPDAALMTPEQIAAQNARLLREDPSMHALEAIPARLSRAQVETWIGGISRRPSRLLHGADGTQLTDQSYEALQAALDLGAIPEAQATRFGMVVRRADLRTFPDAKPAFSDPRDRDIDRFQESALFPGTPVVIAHESRDRRWWFVVAPNYAAWIEADAVAEGSRESVLGYAAKAPFRVVTGARASTVFTPEAPRVSALTLEMGARLPLASVAADAQVNGQHSYTSWPVLLPVREPGGELAFVPALLPKVADTAAAPLPLTRANLIRQAFKFLGERYGWGHAYDGRDCSGFVAEVYRSLGVELPRNTGDQARSPVLANRTSFTAADDRAARERALAALRPGDLIFIPGHLMMALGHVDGALYVIHDIQGGSWLDATGKLRQMHLNGVSVTPFAPLRFDDTSDFTDRMTHILRIP